MFFLGVLGTWSEAPRWVFGIREHNCFLELATVEDWEKMRKSMPSAL